MTSASQGPSRFILQVRRRGRRFHSVGLMFSILHRTGRAGTSALRTGFSWARHVVCVFFSEPRTIAMDNENDDAVEPIDTPTEIDMLLEEAEAFRRGGAPLEALARARVARQVLDEQLNEYPDEEMDPEEIDEADELRAQVNSAIARYERLVAAW